MNTVGIAAGLATAALWAATAVCFEAAARRIGSFAVNFLRLFLAALFFIGLSLSRTGEMIPPVVSGTAWRDLAISGFVGFVLADLMLFRAFVLIGARLAMLIYASVPAMTGLAGYLLLDERVSTVEICGMATTVLGICLAIAGKRSGQSGSRLPSRQGIVLAVGASAGQAAGLLLGKHGAGEMDPFSATQGRVLAGLAGFVGLSLFSGQIRQVTAILRIALRLGQGGDAVETQQLRVALLALTVGALLGPFLGVSLGLLSTQLLAAGIASTLMSLVPVLLIPISAFAFRERVTVTEVLGTLVAIMGVALMV